MKYAVYTTVPRLVFVVLFYLLWVACGITLILTTFRGVSKVLLEVDELQYYNDIVERSNLNIAISYCSFAHLTFLDRRYNFYVRKTLCQVCDVENRNELRDLCVQNEFIDYFNITERRIRFIATLGYEDNYLITSSEINSVIWIQIYLICALVLYLLLPFIIIVIFIIVYYSKHKRVDIFKMLFFNSLEPFGNTNKKYNIIYDPFSNNISNQIQASKFLRSTDPFFYALRISSNKNEDSAELVTWQDRRKGGFENWEKTFLSIISGALIIAVSMTLVILIERFMFEIFSSIIIYSIVPIFLIIIFITLILLAGFLVYKFSTIKVVTNKRVFYAWRLPIWGAFIKYVDIKDIREAVDNNGKVHVVEKNGRETFMFKSPRLSGFAVNSISDFVERLNNRVNNNVNNNNNTEDEDEGDEETDDEEGEEEGEEREMEERNVISDEEEIIRERDLINIDESESEKSPKKVKFAPIGDQLDDLEEEKINEKKSIEKEEDNINEQVETDLSMLSEDKKE